MQKTVWLIGAAILMISCADIPEPVSLSGTSLLFTDGTPISTPDKHEDFPVRLGENFYYIREVEDPPETFEFRVYHARELANGRFEDLGLLAAPAQGLDPLSFESLTYATTACQSPSLLYSSMFGITLAGSDYLVFATGQDEQFDQDAHQLCFIRLATDGKIDGPTAFSSYFLGQGVVHSVQATAAGVTISFNTVGAEGVELFIQQLEVGSVSPSLSLSLKDELAIPAPDVSRYGSLAPVVGGSTEYSVFLSAVPVPAPGGRVFLLTDVYRVADSGNSLSLGLALYNPANGKTLPVLDRALPGKYLKSPNVSSDVLYFSAISRGTSIRDGDLYRMVAPRISQLPEYAALADSGPGLQPAPAGWVQQAFLKADNRGNDDTFGNKVAISGNVVVVGARQEDSNQTTIINGPNVTGDNEFATNAGAVYVYRRSGTTWTQEAYLKPSNAGAGDNFGSSVAVSGDTIVVGATGEDSDTTGIQTGTLITNENSTARGAAYVFVRTNGAWTQQAYLKTPVDVGNDYEFGRSAAIWQDTIVIGTRFDDHNQNTIQSASFTYTPTSANSGAAHVFRRSGSTWTQEAYIKAPNADAGDGFGESVAIAGDTLVVGAPFERNDTSSSTSAIGGVFNLPADNNNTPNAGAAYVFVRSGSTWSTQAYLKAPNNPGGFEFGQSVAVSGNTVVVGAHQEDNNDGTVVNAPDSIFAPDVASGAGATYVYIRRGSTWSWEAYLKAENPVAGDLFGFSVAIDGNLIAVGAYGEDTGAGDSGIVYVFRKNNGLWTREAGIKSPVPGNPYNLGQSVAISGTTIVAGALFDDSNSATINGLGASSDTSLDNSGAVHIFIPR